MAGISRAKRASERNRPRGMRIFFYGSHHCPRRYELNIAMWVLAGGVLGWVGFQYLEINSGRGLMVSVIIGAVGGFFGGKVVAPMFTTAAAIPADFSSSALVFAALAAAAFLYAGNLIHDRWGV
jgi:uncharacterized membrane protein YeaQ/YmgE (transglycosylase-associated protein family)